MFGFNSNSLAYFCRFVMPGTPLSDIRFLANAGEETAEKEPENEAIEHVGIGEQLDMELLAAAQSIACEERKENIELVESWEDEFAEDKLDVERIASEEDDEDEATVAGIEVH